MRKLLLILILIPLVSASDVLVWQGQFYTGTTFHQGTYEFNFTVYDSLTNGNICYSNLTNLTTGTWGQWKTEQTGVSSSCNNASKDYFLNIEISGIDQTPRRRLTMFNYLRKDTDESTTGNLTIGSKLAFILNELIDNLVDGWLRITGNLNVTGNTETINISAIKGQFSYVDKSETTAPNTPPNNTLRLYVEAKDGFSVYKFKDDTGMVRELVRDSVFIVRNAGTENISKMSAVYDCGSLGNYPKICLAQADNISKSQVIGITIEQINTSSFGRVMQVGLLENVNTNAFTEGNFLYLSDSQAGNLTTTPPLTPNLTTIVGTVLVKGIGNGAIQVLVRELTGDEFGTINNFVVQGNITTNELIKLSVNLPACNSITNGSIGRNSTKLYFCDGSIWNGLY